LSPQFQSLVEQYGPRSAPAVLAQHHSKEELVDRLTCANVSRLAHVRGMSESAIAQPMPDGSCSGSAHHWAPSIRFGFSRRVSRWTVVVLAQGAWTPSGALVVGTTSKRSCLTTVCSQPEGRQRDVIQLVSSLDGSEGPGSEL